MRKAFLGWKDWNMSPKCSINRGPVWKEAGFLLIGYVHSPNVLQTNITAIVSCRARPAKENPPKIQ